MTSQTSQKGNQADRYYKYMHRQSVAIAVIFSDTIIQIFVPVCKFIQIISTLSGVKFDAVMDFVFILSKDCL